MVFNYFLNHNNKSLLKNILKMIYLILLGLVFLKLNGFSIKKEINKLLENLKHKILILNQNLEHKKELDKQAKLYNNKKENLKRNSEIRINEITSETEKEINKIKEKYTQIISSLDKIKSQDDFIKLLNNLKLNNL
jgi:hypothetical protein